MNINTLVSYKNNIREEIESIYSRYSLNKRSNILMKHYYA